MNPTNKISFSIFLDSDVVISSVISNKGAAFAVVCSTLLTKYISDLSLKEINEVGNRLNLPLAKLKKHTSLCSLTEISETTVTIKNTYALYCSDPFDAHIVAGAVTAEVRFLITYNIKHFNRRKIKEDFGILVITPGQLLQYLRSLN